MAKQRINQRACDELASRNGTVAEGAETVAGGRSYVWDDQMPGFGLRLNGPGRVSFVLKYLVRGNPKQRFVTLGDYPTLKPDQARAEATAIKAAAKLGRDLLGERKAEVEQEAKRKQDEANRSLSMAELLDMTRATIERAKDENEKRGRSSRYEQEMLRLEARVLRPEVGRGTLADFDPRRLQAFLSLQPSVSTARNLRAVMVRLATIANAEMTRRGVDLEWPTTFKLPTLAGKQQARTHRYTLDEMARLWIGAGALGRRGALIRWMQLTGCRRGEAQRVLWSHLALEDPILGPHWTQPAHLTKTHREHRVPLAGPAVAMLGWLPKREVKPGQVSELIFAGRGGKPIGDWTVVRRAMLEQAGVDAGTLHDFRRTIVSTLGDHGFDPQVADALLNHAAAATLSGVMGVYQRSEFWSKRREAITLWTDLLMEAVSKRLGRPVAGPAWGFDQPFEDVRILRPERRKAPAAAAEKPPARGRRRRAG